MSRKKSVDLTDKEERGLRFISEFIDTHGRAPILRELSEHMGWSAPSTAYFLVRSLREKGKLVHESHRPIQLAPPMAEPA